MLRLEHIQKKYGTYTASDDVSFNITPGSIFGLLGPNGAGKTTLIRMITRILYPDSGTIYFDGQPLQEKHTEQIGYMPEERGLYKKMKVLEQLVYLGMLKGMTRQQANEASKNWLDKFDIAHWSNKTIDELSKGMSQKVQFIATVLHQPRLLILDEPFSGLDPINSQLIEDEIRQLSKEGKTIIFSTHRMEQVEGICSDIVLINKGQKILDGAVASLKQQFKQNLYAVKSAAPIPLNAINGLNVVAHQGDELKIQLRENERPNDILKQLIEQDVEIQSYQEILPSIQQIFIEQVKNHHG